MSVFFKNKNPNRKIVKYVFLLTPPLYAGCVTKKSILFDVPTFSNEQANNTDTPPTVSVGCVTINALIDAIAASKSDNTIGKQKKKKKKNKKK